MSVHNHYDMSLRKDGLYISLSSDDVYFISRQMDKWFHIMLDDRYKPVSSPRKKEETPSVAASVPIPSPSPLPAVPVPAEAPLPAVNVPVAQASPAPPPVALPEEIVQPIIPVPAAGPSVTPLPTRAEEPTSTAADTIEDPGMLAAMSHGEPVPHPLPMSLPVDTVESVAAQPVVSDMATEVPGSTLPPPAAFVPAEIPVAPSIPPAPASQSDLPPDLSGVNLPPVAASSIVEPANPAAKPSAPANEDDFEAIMNTVMQDLEEGPVPPVADPVVNDGLSMHERIALEQARLSQSNPIPPDEPSTVVGSAADSYASLADLSDRANPQNTHDYLLMAAYYLTTVDHQETFSLKRLNGSLVKAGLPPVNHGALEAALEKGVLTMVPDLTGTAEVSEYRLSPSGMTAFQALLAP